LRIHSDRRVCVGGGLKPRILKTQFEDNQAIQEQASWGIKVIL